MEIESRGYNTTPGKYILTLLGTKGFRVSHLIEWFEAIHLEKALIHLKPEEPIRITEHPKEFVQINEGGSFSLTCRAESYPLPDYLWYKNDEPLPLQVDPVLSIKSASLEDSGIYTCLVTKWCSQINQYEWIYSNFSNVEVLHRDFRSPLSFLGESSFSLSHSAFPERNLFTSEKNHNVPPSVKEKSIHQKTSNIKTNSSPENKNAEITITKQPYFTGKVAQGMSVCLNCEAASNFPLSYLWFCNGKPLFDEKSSQLILKYLYPDPNTAETKWEYQCKIYNDHYEIFSRGVVVALDEVNDTTPYVAQEKIALMIANDTYDHLENLVKPAADVFDLANLLSSMNFRILAFRNLTLTGMRNAIDLFCSMLQPGSYALFFYAGHGFELYGQTYLQSVDSSDRHLVEESICTEYLLQCMQKTKPSLNVLLLDSCRKLPPCLRRSSKYESDIPAGRIFQAQMKNNTIYGYSTSFLRAAHESYTEVNSVFVKHLKKYITHNKSIEELLMSVKKDFAKDPLTKNIQFPVVESSLSDPRKLCDPVHDKCASAEQFSILNWCDIKGNITSKSFNISNLKIIITVEFHHHMEVFCNGIDIFIYLHVDPNANMRILHDMDINITFKTIYLQNILKVLPTSGISLENANLESGKRNFLFKKQLLHVEKISSQILNGDLSLKFCSKNEIKNIEFAIDVSQFVELLNHLQSSDVEEHKEYSNAKNSFM